MKLKLSIITALVLTFVGVTFWELYWRSQGFNPSLDDNDALWAVERAKVDKLSKADIVLIGSSRVHFDIQLDKWEEKIGKKPIQLAMGGSTPLPVFHNLVNESNFKGTILVGVTPGLFFSGANPKAGSWKRPQKKIDHFYDRTYAQMLNHQLSIPLQNSFAFLSEAKGVDGIKLKVLVNNVKVGNRAAKPRTIPPFHNFGVTRLDRNVRMKKRMVTDTAYANTVKRVWSFFIDDGNLKPKKDEAMEFFIKDLKKFKEKGGRVILLRCPSSEKFRINEDSVTNRKEYWDVLVEKAQVKAYHFEDYENLQGLNIPEWSHLSAEDADVFTNTFIDIMLKDNILTNQKPTKK